MHADGALVEAAGEVLAAAPLGAHSRICCALSGGVDSLVLFEVLRRLQPRFGYRLAAAHVDHGLSPHAGDWADACARRCAAAGIPLQVFRVGVDRDHPHGLEAAARSARYGALERVACDWLVFGHHLDDQAETLLFRLLRGTGVRGAAAMRPVVVAAAGAPGRLRPLLAVRREQILDWARRNALDWVEDESNDETRFTRNAIRHRLVPVAEALFPAAVPVLARAADHFAEADALLGELAAGDVAACGGEPLDRARLRALSPARQANLLRWLLQQRGAPTPSRARLDDVLQQLRDCPPAQALRLSLGAWVCCAYRDALWLEPAIAAVPERCVWQGEAVLPWGADEVCFVGVTGEGVSRVRLARAAAVYLAPRVAGMRLRLSPARPRREFRKLCQEAAIPEWVRDRLPVLWVDAEPAWVGGIGVAAEFACAPGEAGVLPCWRPAGGSSPG
ncbi:MAG: tRNA lysidine(34) synthetase TilS [Thauera phenolivorans]|uniref:tRNA(Ile)-lysidine synthase n=1 Tax=Thauera phenolivorans TaxID=1792543 RepID=A0A7X7LYD1_9RHOO|nr:tRNA lysidine(34) synthetase TilS [Thauera phenolivorans]